MDKGGKVEDTGKYLALLDEVAGNNARIRSWVKKCGLD